MPSLKAKLTQHYVDSVEAKDKRFVIWDSEIGAFGLRVMPSGVKSYILRYRVGQGRLAKGRTITLGRSTDLRCEAARAKAKDFRSEARIGRDPEADRRRDELAILKVSELIEDWGREAAPFNRRTGAPRKPNRYKSDLSLLRAHVGPILGAKRITNIARYDIMRLRDAITNGETRSIQKTKPRGISEFKGGGGTARRTIAMLKSVFA
ncbi:MAG: Arm DNA-binding domain-containing protein, partial [Hyphomonadaceae bacterium]